MVAKNVAAMTVVDMPEVDVKAAAELVDPSVWVATISFSSQAPQFTLATPQVTAQGMLLL